MGRPREFDERQVLLKATELFGQRGYDAVTVDVMLKYLGVSRASFYKLYGSKQRLCQLALESACERAEQGGSEADAVARDRDLVVVALLELAPLNEDLRRISLRAFRLCFADDAESLGRHLLNRADRPRN